MQPKISIVTLGVSDVQKSAGFYERLGFTRSKGASQEQIVFFQLHGQAVLALYERNALAEDANLPPGPAQGFSGVTLALTLPSPEDVDRVMAEAEAAGASIAKPAQNVFWGGYSGYFTDPDGHAWELAHNPFVQTDETGGLTLPE